MYIETSKPRWPKDKALFESSLLQSYCDDQCFTFYYNMHGSDIGTLGVLLKSNGKNTVLWTLNGNQGPGWKAARIQISNMPKDAKVGLLLSIVS